jgi:CubicO group peptidase (beta-lactamase class C family)
MNLNIPPEIEVALSLQAKAAGQSLEAYLRERILEPAEEGQDLPATPADQSARARRFEEWVASHRIVTHEVDDSRDSIYSGRGE